MRTASVFDHSDELLARLQHGPGEEARQELAATPDGPPPSRWTLRAIRATFAWLHDYTWLAALFEAAGRLQRFRVEDLRSLLSEAQAARWDGVKNEVASEMRLQRHRASADAKLLQSTLKRVREAG